MGYHIFKNLAEPTDWNNAIYFDIETADNIETMKKIAMKEISKEEQVEFLNPANLKHIAIGLWVNENEKIHKIEGYKIFRKGNAVIYYNIEKIDVISAVNTLLKIAELYNRKSFVAHHGKRFDFLIFIYHPIPVLRFMKNTYYLQVRKKFFKLIDTMDNAKAIGITKLDELAKTLGLQGKNLFEAKTIGEYNANDVYVLMQIGKKFAELGMHGTPTRTSRLWLANILSKIGIKEIKQESIPLDYIGGRTEVFWHKGENLYCFDANSLYPSVMSKFLFPPMIGNEVKFAKINDYFFSDIQKYIIEKLKKLWNEEIENQFELHKNFEKTFDYHFLLYVKINGIKNEIPEWQKSFAMNYFPFSFYRNEKRYFKFEKDMIYQVQGYEIVFLHFFNWEILGGYYWKPMKVFFADDMEKLYIERKRLKKENNPLQMLYKIIMNSTYGIFGLRDTKVEPLEKHRGKIGSFFMELQEGIRKGIEGKIYRDILLRQEVVIGKDLENGMNVKYYIGRDFSFFSIPIWATHITSSARYWLHLTMLFLTKMGKKIWYCDTDSVFTNATPEDFEKLQLLGDNLLQWKCEYSIEKALFFLPKCYILKINDEVKIKAKGVGKKLINEFVSQRISKEGNLIEKNKVGIIVKRFVNPLGAPKKIPDINEKHWKSIWNTKEKTFLETFPHNEVLKMFPEITEEYIKVFLESGIETLINKIRLT